MAAKDLPPLKHSGEKRLWAHTKINIAYALFTRATVPVLTSVKEEKHVILPTTLNFAPRRGKLRIYTLRSTP